ncbi:MAG: four helix bundle protein [Elusimicrobiota bacterium]|jgi:four helix bundle protein
MNSLNKQNKAVSENKLTEPFLERCVRFSVCILDLAQTIPKTPVTRPVIDQLVRSSMAIGANTSEAKSAQSRADFISKFEIALKEARETGYWIEVVRQAHLTPDAVGIKELAGECYQLTAILVSSVKTAKQNAKTRK